MYGEENLEIYVGGTDGTAALIIEPGVESNVGRTEYNPIVTGIELLESPVPVAVEELANSPTSRLKLYELDQLMSEDFYNETFYEQTVEKASKKIRVDLSMVDKIVSSPLIIEHVPDDIDSSGSVKYRQAIQFARERDDGKVSVERAQAYLYNQTEGVLSKYVPYDRDFEGLAHVAIFSQAVDLSKHFESPGKASEFDGNFMSYKDASILFETYFEDLVNERAQEIQDKMNVTVKGVLFSPIELKRELGLLGFSATGELRLAASYLI